MSSIDSRFSIKWLVVLPTLLLLLSLPACQNDRHLQEPDVPVAEGESFTATLGLQANDLREVTTRTTGVENLTDITTLKVLVFDGDYKFLYSSDAVLEKQVKPAPADDNAYLPDNKQEGITEMFHFKVTLEKSSDKRHLHFIANHDWSGTNLTAGKSAGELLPSLKPAALTDANPYNRMWSVVTVESLDENTLKDKVVKLLRSYAKLSVELVRDASGQGNFILTEYSIINGMSQGSVVPFTMQNYDYSFSFPPYNATVPATAEVSTGYNWVQADQEALLYEATQESDTPVALIIKGRKKGSSGYGDERYWKIDLVTNKEITNPTNGTNYTVPVTFPLLRNRHYVVKMSDLVQSDGFATPEDARQAPASNNIFASIELRNFEQVSDGTFRLEVSPINKIVSAPGEYDFSVIFTQTTTAATGGQEETPLGDQVQYNLSWDPATDPYLGTFEKGTVEGNVNHFTLKAKQIPTDETKIYTIDILGPRENGQTPIYRKIRLYLRPPFRFNAVLHPAAAGSQERLLEFDVPQDIPATLVPFNVFIQTTDMTPVNVKAAERKAHLVHIGGKTYYQYTVTVEDHRAGKVVLRFVMHDADTKTRRTVQLSSDFYVTQNLLAENAIYRSVTGHIYYGTPDERKIQLPNSSELRFQYDGQLYNREELYNSTGILIEPLAVGSNEFRIIVEEGYLAANKDKVLQIVTNVLYPNTYGYLNYNVKTTKTIQEWMQGDTSGSNEATLTTYEVEMVGRLLTWPWIVLGLAWTDGAYTGLTNIRVRGYDVDGGAPSDLSSYLTIYANSYQKFDQPDQDGRSGYYYSLVLPKDMIPKRWVHFRNSQNDAYEEWLWERLESKTDFAVRYE